MYSNKKAFTLVELIVSMLISVLVLGGIFYFLSDTIAGISRSTSQAQFLRDFYSFSSILNTGRAQSLGDNTVLLTNLNKTKGALLGAVDLDTLKINNDTSQYDLVFLGYKSLTGQQIADIELNSSIINNYTFDSDDLFTNFYLKDLEFTPYNAGALMEMKLDIFTEFKVGLKGELWSDIPQGDIYTYSIVF